jgi:6-phosphogluconate dehydrogenase
MELGMVGLGRMGANMAQRLVQGGHAVSGFDPSAEARQRAAASGIAGAGSLAALVAGLAAPRAIWLMVPAGKIVEDTLDALLPLLAAGDTVIDGGNSYYKDSVRRAARLEAAGIGFVDCGTSGGIWGLAEGYSMMVGGSDAALARLKPLFETLAPSPTTGWGHVGPAGAGHFTKMVHNGIEYGMMQAYAEGFAILERKADFKLDLHQVAQVWQTGSVVRSWLLDVTAEVLKDNPALAGIAAYVEDSGEGRWTVAEAIDLDLAAPVITLSLLERLRSRAQDSYADKLLAAMRNGFGGHRITPE